MALTWSIGISAPVEDLAVVSTGVFNHGRAQAHDGDAKPIYCLIRDENRVVAGGLGRTEYLRLFVQHLWVAEHVRNQGIGSRILRDLEAEAAKRGCRDALIETLDDSVAQLYSRLGYQSLACVRSYVGRFNRHIMLKPALLPPR